MTATSPVPQDPSAVAPADVVATVGRLLLEHGHTTAHSLQSAQRLAQAYGLDVAVVADWSALTVIEAPGRAIVTVPIAPEGVNMAVVSAVLTTVRSACDTAAPPEPADLLARLHQDAARRPYPVAVFALACATGATALAVIFGAVHPSSYVLIPLAAAVAGVARRMLGARGVGMVGQAFVAALIAGLAGALSIVWDVTSPARLVAVAPAMVLVPGPHLLNGAIDVATRRMGIGLGRLAYGSLIVLAICAGLLLGLSVAGPLPVAPSGGSTSLWLDVLAAAVAAGSYPIYFSLDARLIVWPVLVGALAHAARWLTMAYLDVGVPAGAFVACCVAGLVLTVVARRTGASFAGIGFAAVVALVPGLFLFHGVAGIVVLTQHPDAQVVTWVAGDLSTASLTLAAMCLGLVATHTISDRLTGAARRRS